MLGCLKLYSISLISLTISTTLFCKSLAQNVYFTSLLLGQGLINISEFFWLFKWLSKLFVFLFSRTTYPGRRYVPIGRRLVVIHLILKTLFFLLDFLQLLSQFPIFFFNCPLLITLCLHLLIKRCISLTFGRFLIASLTLLLSSWFRGSSYWLQSLLLAFLFFVQLYVWVSVKIRLSLNSFEVLIQHRTWLV